MNGKLKWRDEIQRKKKMKINKNGKHPFIGWPFKDQGIKLVQIVCNYP